MDPTSTHFGFYDAFPVATPVPGGGQPAQSQDDWAHLRYNYDQLMPVHGRGFINLAPPNPRLFYPYNPDPLSTISFHPIVGAHVERLEFQDPVDWYVCDLNVYVLLLSLALTDADVSDPASPHPINPRFALDQPISTPPPCVDEVEDAISHGVDYTSPAQIWSHIDVDDDGACVCLWKDVLGGACGFRSSADRVKRHLLRVHFGLKYVISYEQHMC